MQQILTGEGAPAFQDFYSSRTWEPPHPDPLPHGEKGAVAALIIMPSPLGGEGRRSDSTDSDG